MRNDLTYEEGQQLFQDSATIIEGVAGTEVLPINTPVDMTGKLIDTVETV